MKITLKKFATDPKHLIKKAPIIIVINREPEYAIIPYVVYKANYEKAAQAFREKEQRDHKSGNAMFETATFLPKRSRLWRLLFE